MQDLAETYLARAQECRRLAAQAHDPVLVDYLVELATALEQEAAEFGSEGLPPIPLYE
jgi:hypothetical protein